MGTRRSPRKTARQAIHRPIPLLRRLPAMVGRRASGRGPRDRPEIAAPRLVRPAIKVLAKMDLRPACVDRQALTAINVRRAATMPTVPVRALLAGKVLRIDRALRIVEARRREMAVAGHRVTRKRRMATPVRRPDRRRMAGRRGEALDQAVHRRVRANLQRSTPRISSSDLIKTATANFPKRSSSTG
jgi:hypothetical protein